MLRYIVATALFLILLSQLPGCHFYVDAVPRVIISSEQFSLPSPPNNDHPNPPGPNAT